MPSTLPTNAQKSSPAQSGKLFVVATPIGHMEDITLRALGTLAEVDLVAAEDTRHTRKLFVRHGISTPLISFHDHNKEKRTPEMLDQLNDGKTIALVTDAGTPSISDPGYYLVKKALKEAIPVVPIPGPSAAIAALSVSGLPSDSFVFLGFVPRKSGKRREFLDRLQWEHRTLIFYESPKRLLGLVRTMCDVFGNRQAVLARELTKIHEEIIRGGLKEIAKDLGGRPSLKGECTLLVAGFDRKRDVDMDTVRNYLRRLHLEKGGTLSKLAKEVAGEFGLSRQAVYEEALKIEKQD
jgi:16S rRNA (cytidine1402-2'-O)-methyltransferase